MLQLLVAFRSLLAATSSGSFVIAITDAGTTRVSGSLTIKSGDTTKGTSGAISVSTGNGVCGAGGSISMTVGSVNLGVGGGVTISAGKSMMLPCQVIQASQQVVVLLASELVTRVLRTLAVP